MTWISRSSVLGLLFLCTGLLQCAFAQDRKPVDSEEVQSLLEEFSKDPLVQELIETTASRQLTITKGLLRMSDRQLSQAQKNLAGARPSSSPDLMNPELSDALFDGSDDLRRPVDLIYERYASATPQAVKIALGNLLKNALRGNAVQLYEDIFRESCESGKCPCIRQCLETYAGRAENAGFQFWVDDYFGDEAATLQDHMDFAAALIEFRMIQLSCASQCIGNEVQEGRGPACRRDADCARGQFCHKPPAGRASCKPERSEGQSCVRDGQCASNCCKLRPSIILGIPSKECRPSNRC